MVDFTEYEREQTHPTLGCHRRFKFREAMVWHHWGNNNHVEERVSLDREFCGHNSGMVLSLCLRCAVKLGVLW